ncbi:hypothetical protein PMAYCL1PPCAC_09211, partial [Pristionchus mayeri]
FRLLNEGAFRVATFDHMYDPVSHKRFTEEDEDGCVTPVADAPLVGMKALTEDRAMQQLAMLQKSYERAKKDVGLRGVTQREIDVIDSARKYGREGLRFLANAQETVEMEEMRAKLGLERHDPESGTLDPLGYLLYPSRLEINRRAILNQTSKIIDQVTASRRGIDSFDDGDETVPLFDTDYRKNAPVPREQEKTKGGHSRKTHKEKLLEVLLELHIAKMENRSPRNPSWMVADQYTVPIRGDIKEGKKEQKGINKNEAKRETRAGKFLPPVWFACKSKEEEEEADRQLVESLQSMDVKEDRRKVAPPMAHLRNSKKEEEAKDLLCHELRKVIGLATVDGF